jgi:hypothetical protein
MNTSTETPTNKVVDAIMAKASRWAMCSVDNAADRERFHLELREHLETTISAVPEKVFITFQDEDEDGDNQRACAAYGTKDLAYAAAGGRDDMEVREFDVRLEPAGFEYEATVDWEGNVTETQRVPKEPGVTQLGSSLSSVTSCLLHNREVARAHGYGDTPQAAELAAKNIMENAVAAVRNQVAAYVSTWRTEAK